MLTLVNLLVSYFCSFASFLFLLIRQFLIFVNSLVSNSCYDLRVLSVSQNKLRCLPCSIGGCINLETIDCANNLIETLPIEMFACHSLAKFNLDNNRSVSSSSHTENNKSQIKN